MYLVWLEGKSFNGKDLDRHDRHMKWQPFARYTGGTFAHQEFRGKEEIIVWYYDLAHHAEDFSFSLVLFVSFWLDFFNMLKRLAYKGRSLVWREEAR